MKGTLQALLIVTLLLAPCDLLAATGHIPGDGLRDISGPVPPTGLPPFAATAAVIILAAAGAVTSRYRKTRKKEELAVSSDEALADDFSSLRKEYESGRMSEALLFDRLSALLRESLAGAEDNLALTDEEIVAQACGNVPADILERAAKLLELCETVRFGNLQPGKSAARAALDDALDTVAHLRRTP